MSISQTYLDWQYQSNIIHIQFEALLKWFKSKQRKQILGLACCVQVAGVHICTSLVKTSQWEQLSLGQYQYCFFLRMFSVSFLTYICFIFDCFHPLHLYWTKWVHRRWQGTWGLNINMCFFSLNVFSHSSFLLVFIFCISVEQSTKWVHRRWRLARQMWPQYW